MADYRIPQTNQKHSLTQQLQQETNFEVVTESPPSSHFVKKYWHVDNDDESIRLST